MSETRPCIATIGGEEYRALFHCWAVRQYTAGGILAGSVPGQVTYAYAIVECEDGSVRCAKPDGIRFLDTTAMFAEYAWDYMEAVEE